MWRDFALASMHHVLVIALVAMLASQMAILRGPPDASAVQRLGRVDVGYGISAVLLLVVGLLRVWQGAKGADYYLHNPWFHAKVGAYVVAALLSLLPTLAYARWRRALATDGTGVPNAAQWARARAFVRAQFALLVVIVIAAAGMARYGGL